MHLLKYWPIFLQYALSSTGAIWLIIESYEGLTNHEANLGFIPFLIIAVALGLLSFLFSGMYVSGFLRNSIEISNAAFDSRVRVEFGDLFEGNGWKIISVNDFFDSEVNGKIVASESLHGHVLERFWSGRAVDWDNSVLQSMSAPPIETVNRSCGKKERYALGTTSLARAGEHAFIFVALSTTDVEDYTAQATAENLICAVRSALARARAEVSNQPIKIPLLGSGLARVGLRERTIADLILVAVVEETKIKKITSSINIILPNTLKGEINLLDIDKDWR